MEKLSEHSMKEIHARISSTNVPRKPWRILWAILVGITEDISIWTLKDVLEEILDKFLKVCFENACGRFPASKTIEAFKDFLEEILTTFLKTLLENVFVGIS